MPTISAQYQAMLLKCSEAVAKEALKHEVDWQGWGHKMIERAK